MNFLPAAGGAGLIAVNIFSVPTGNQRELVDAIRSANTGAEVPGLLAMHLLRSLDGTQVINHMQWADREAFARPNPVIEATRDRVHALIEGPGPARFEIIPVL